MLRVSSHIQIQDERQLIQAYADSTDQKPTDFEGKKLAEGSSVFEVDTGALYLYSEKSETWIQQ